MPLDYSQIPLNSIGLVLLNPVPLFLSVGLVRRNNGWLGEKALPPNHAQICS